MKEWKFIRMKVKVLNDSWIMSKKMNADGLNLVIFFFFCDVT